MKRLFFVILALVLLLCGCGGEEIAINDLEGISMEISGELSNRAAAIVISVDAYQVFSGNGEFFLQELKNGKWRDIEEGVSGVSSARREDFGRGDRQEFYCVWEHVYGPLEQGHYRIVKEIHIGVAPGVGQVHYLAAEFDIGPEQITEQLWVRDEAPYVSIVSGGESVVPYFHFATAHDWDAEHGAWIFADGTYLEYELPELAAGLPLVNYSEGFELVYNRDSGFYQLFIYDENYHLIYHGTDMSELDKLESGKYFVGIHVMVQGEYIPEGDDRESSSYEAVVALEKQ